MFKSKLAKFAGGLVCFVMFLSVIAAIACLATAGDPEQVSSYSVQIDGPDFLGSYVLTNEDYGVKQEDFSGSGSMEMTFEGIALTVTVMKDSDDGQLVLRIDKGDVTLDEGSTESPYGSVTLSVQ